MITETVAAVGGAVVVEGQGQTETASGWLDIRDEAGLLLFRFDPARQLVEVKTKQMKAARVVDLSLYQGKGAA